MHQKIKFKIKIAFHKTCNLLPQRNIITGKLLRYVNIQMIEVLC